MDPAPTPLEISVDDIDTETVGRLRLAVVAAFGLDVPAWQLRSDGCRTYGIDASPPRRARWDRPHSDVPTGGLGRRPLSLMRGHCDEPMVLVLVPHLSRSVRATARSSGFGKYKKLTSFAKENDLPVKRRGADKLKHRTRQADDDADAALDKNKNPPKTDDRYEPKSDDLYVMEATPRDDITAQVCLFVLQTEVSSDAHGALY